MDRRTRSKFLDARNVAGSVVASAKMSMDIFNPCIQARYPKTKPIYCRTPAGSEATDKSLYARVLRLRAPPTRFVASASASSNGSACSRPSLCSCTTDSIPTAHRPGLTS